MTKRRAVSLFGFLLLAAAGVAAALYLTNRRGISTASDPALQLYREATENERRFYFKEARLGFARALELDPDFALAMLGLARLSEKDQALSSSVGPRASRGDSPSGSSCTSTSSSRASKRARMNG